MPIHDWTRVDAGIFHAFHHGWIEEIASREKGSGLFCAKHPSGRSGKRVLTPFPHPWVSKSPL